jgi:hypothetical protein
VSLLRTALLGALTIGCVRSGAQPRSAPDALTNPAAFEAWLHTPDVRPRNEFLFAFWIGEGAEMAHVADAIATRLERQSPEHPSRDAARLCSVFGELGDHRRSAIRALIRLLDAPDELVRDQALTALGRQGAPTDVRAFSRWLTPTSPRRGLACDAASALHASDAETVAFYEALAADKTATIAGCAVGALKALGRR